MDRRNTLAALLGRSTNSSTLAAPPVVVTTLNPYTGEFTDEQAAHLLRRTMFGPTWEQINQAVSAGLDATLTQLFSTTAMPEPPLNFIFEDDPNVPVGETWINAPYIQGVNLQAYRRASLSAWQMGLIYNEGVSLREKMTLFWHNHFVTAEIQDAKFVYNYITTLRENALGNFRELVKLMTIDPAMLRYLNGNDNTAVAPNENYARELLELFTIGKGPQVGPGDYTNYTEDDVAAIAKILTGWRDIGFFTQENVEVSSIYIQNRHDTSDKQLSFRFNDAIIQNNNEQEYSDLIDVIFEQDEVARFICRKLYRWFVYYVITEQTEADVIEPMAQLLRDNNYDISVALDALLRSEHFYEMIYAGPMIKNPIDFLASVIKTNEVALPANTLQLQYSVWFQTQRVLEGLQMPLFSPPSVAGYPAYYQEPSYYRLWMNSVTLPLRMDITNTVAGNGFQIGGQSIQINVLERVVALENPSDPNDLIDELSAILFPQPLLDEQKTYLKNILIPGLPDYEWTIEYSEWAADPQGSGLQASIEGKLRQLYQAMLTMPEYFLS